MIKFNFLLNYAKFSLEEIATGRDSITGNPNLIMEKPRFYKYLGSLGTSSSKSGIPAPDFPNGRLSTPQPSSSESLLNLSPRGHVYQAARVLGPQEIEAYRREQKRLELMKEVGSRFLIQRDTETSTPKERL